MATVTTGRFHRNSQRGVSPAISLLWPFGGRRKAVLRRHDTVSERLRRWTRNPLGSARRGSNPLGVVLRSPLLCACVV